MSDSETTTQQPATTSTAEPAKVSSSSTAEVVSTSTTAEPKSIQEALQHNPLYHYGQRVVSWKDPVESGLVFAILTFFFYLITLGGYTVITLVSYLLLAFLLSAAAYVNGLQFYGQFRGQQIENPLVAKFKNYKFNVSRRDLEPHLLLVELILNQFLSSLSKAIFVTDLKYTLKFAFGAWVASFIGSWSIPALIYLGIVVAFVWPRLYAEKQKEIDDIARLVRQKLNFYLKQAISKLPPAIKAKLE